MTRQIIPHSEVLLLIGKPDRGTLRRWVKEGNFPAPIQLVHNKIAWYEDEVEQWLDSQQRVNYAPSPQAA